MTEPKHEMFVIKGNYSKKFLESMGYKPLNHPLCSVSKEPMMPLEPVRLAYALRINADLLNEGTNEKNKKVKKL